MNRVTTSELHRIINRSVVLYFDLMELKLDEEMLDFQKRYFRLSKQNFQLTIFGEPLPIRKEVDFAVRFCNTLEQYHLSNDVDAKEDFELSHQQYITLLKGLRYYRQFAPTENVHFFDALENNIKAHLPEYRLYSVIDSYNKDIEIIKSQYKAYKKAKRRKESCSSFEHQRQALYFFKDILVNKELGQMPACPQKIALFQNCIDIVDCLPKEKYSRIAKYELKRNFNLAIFKMAGVLPNPDEFLIQKSYNEYIRFTEASNRALSYVNDYKMQMDLRKKREESDLLFR